MKYKLFFLSTVTIGLILCASFPSFSEECRTDINMDGIVDKLDAMEFRKIYKIEKGSVDCDSPCSNITICGEECVDINTDENNCGSCGVSCDQNEICRDGVCEFACPPDMVVIGDECIDPNTSEQFCGASGDMDPGEACINGEICQNGNCVLNCPSGQVAYAGMCIDPDTDDELCGASGPISSNPGVDCSATGRICEWGSCVCPGSLTYIGGRCVDTDIDPEYCGVGYSDCTNLPANTVDGYCNSGACNFVCQDDYGDCDGIQSNGCETSFMESVNNCGRCGRTCTDPNNAVAFCSSGECYFTCIAGYFDCDMNPTNGCETNIPCAQ